MKKRQLNALMLAGAASALLSGCGGGGDSTPSPSPSPPSPSPPPAPPTITTQPVDRTVTSGGTATFIVVAGGASLAYRWQSSPDGTTWTDIAGATTATLTLNAVVPADNNRRVRVVVSNGDGSVTSNAATLMVNATAASFAALASALPARRALHAAVRLADGKVLICGGLSAPDTSAAALSSALLFDPATNAFAPVTGAMVFARANHTATLLPNGLVLIAGGQYDNDNNDDGHASAEIYDPATQTFSALVATMTSPRGGHAAAALNDGRVLITGGFHDSPVALNSAELFDPTTQTFTPIAATTAVRRSEHRATLLPDGRVLITGGGSSDVAFDTAEIYNSATQTFAALGARMTAAREVHASSLLPDGRVLISGGGGLGASAPATGFTLNSAEVFDPASQTFAALAATLTVRRLGHSQTLLSDGTVLVVGGGEVADGAITFWLSAEVYGP